MRTILETVAGDVTVGDFLVDLDNGYVVEVEPEDYGRVTITFHDVDGEECTLSVPYSHYIRITPGEPV